MSSRNALDEESKRIRRQQKFSSDAREKIINDPLRDRALLSRSNTASLNNLQKSPKARGELLEALRSIWSHSDGSKNSQLEHGLRKLREVIISIYSKQKTDREFVRFSYQVYELSYEFYLSQKDYRKLGNLVLKFMVTNMPKNLITEYMDVYALFIAHIECDMGNCLQFVRNWMDLDNHFEGSTKRYVQMSVVFNNHTQSPDTWFKLLEDIPKDSLVYRFLKDSPAYTEMSERCLSTVSKCYNQISVDFLLRHWLHGFMVESELNKRFDTKLNAHGTHIIEFKRPRR